MYQMSQLNRKINLVGVLFVPVLNEYKIRLIEVKSLSDILAQVEGNLNRKVGVTLLRLFTNIRTLIYHKSSSNSKHWHY